MEVTLGLDMASLMEVYKYLRVSADNGFNGFCFFFFFFASVDDDDGAGGLIEMT